MGVLSCWRSNPLLTRYESRSLLVCYRGRVQRRVLAGWTLHSCQESRQPQRTRFFTGNNAIDAGAAGAALGVGAQYFANQIFNPCTRGGTRGGNKGTNNRIFGGQTLQNGALGFLAGFAGAALVNSAQGNPCGR